MAYAVASCLPSAGTQVGPVARRNVSEVEYTSGPRAGGDAADHAQMRTTPSPYTPSAVRGDHIIERQDTSASADLVTMPDPQRGVEP